MLAFDDIEINAGPSVAVDSCEAAFVFACDSYLKDVACYLIVDDGSFCLSLKPSL